MILAPFQAMAKHGSGNMYCREVSFHLAKRCKDCQLSDSVFPCRGGMFWLAVFARRRRRRAEKISFCAAEGATQRKIHGNRIKSCNKLNYAHVITGILLQKGLHPIDLNKSESIKSVRCANYGGQPASWEVGKE